MKYKIQIPVELLCEITKYIDDLTLLSKVSMFSKSWYHRHLSETNIRIKQYMPNWINFMKNCLENTIFYADCPDCPMKNKYFVSNLQDNYSNESNKIKDIMDYNSRHTPGTLCPKHTITYLQLIKTNKTDIIFTIKRIQNNSQTEFCKCKILLNKIKTTSQIYGIAEMYIILPLICIKYAINDLINEISLSSIS